MSLREYTLMMVFLVPLFRRHTRSKRDSGHSALILVILFFLSSMKLKKLTEMQNGYLFFLNWMWEQNPWCKGDLTYSQREWHDIALWIVLLNVFRNILLTNYYFCTLLKKCFYSSYTILMVQSCAYRLYIVLITRCFDRLPDLCGRDSIFYGFVCCSTVSITKTNCRNVRFDHQEPAAPWQIVPH